MKPDNTQETIYVGLDTGLPPYLPYPRFLLKMDISQTAKLLYALLLDRTTLSQRNGWQDDQGRTFIVYPIAEIAEMLDKGQTAIKAALNELDAAGLLERKRAGFSAANRLYVKLPPLVRISDPMTVGKATLISAENRPTDGRKSDLMTVGKPTPNNLTINNLIESLRPGRRTRTSLYSYRQHFGYGHGHQSEDRTGWTPIRLQLHDRPGRHH